MAIALTVRQAALLVALAVAVPTALTQQSGKPSIEQTEQATRALATWLESDDFDPDHLALVTKYGEVVVPSLIAALERGPSPAKRELVRRSLDADYEALTRRVRSRTEYVQHYMANFEALHRIRAAQALSSIGGPAARNALEIYAAKAERDDLRTALRQALERIK
jgi:hypothetical protein